MRVRRFLVMGCGSIGRRHIGNLHRLGIREITAFDVRPERTKEFRRLVGVSVVQTLSEAWRQRPQAALVTAPTRTHVPLALEAARRGCHLFIEKPLSDSEQGLSELEKIVRRKKLVTLVGCNMRFQPGLKRIKDLLDKQALGRVVSLRAEVGQYLPDWHPWEDYRRGYSARRELGGGVILDAIHELDYVRWLAGPVEEVSCIADKLSALQINTEDTAAILLRFARGPIGEVHMDYVQRAYSRTCHIIGDRGTVRWDYSAGEVRHYSAARRKWNIYKNPAGWEPNEMFLDEMRHFLRCLEGKEKSAQDVFDASQILRVALAAKKSSASGRTISVR